MRTLFLAFALTVGFAGAAGAQEPVRTGELRAAAPAVAGTVPAPSGITGRVKRGVAAPRAKAAPGVRASVQAAPRRQPAPRVKRPAPRG